MMTDPLQTIQKDIGAYLSLLPEFYYVPVTVVRPRSEVEAVQIQTTIDQALAGLQKKNGKGGIAAIVLMCEGGMPLKKADGYLQITARVRIIENPMVNEGATGTGVTAESLAVTTLNHLSTLDLGGGHKLQGLENGALREADIKGKVAYDVGVYCYHQGPRITRVEPPRVVSVAAPVIITSGTAEALIYYSTDGSYPTPDTATLYTEPLEVAPPFLRVVAYKNGLTPSAVVERTFS